MSLRNGFEPYNWNECYRWAVVSYKMLVPTTCDDNGCEYATFDLNDASLREQIREFCGFDLGGWLFEQVRLYNVGRLSANRIKKLQGIGVIERGGQFSMDDYIVYDKFCNMVNENVLVDKDNSVVSDLGLVKNYVDRYYFYKKGQNYTLDDYIQECIVGLIDAKGSYNANKGNYSNYVNRSIFGHLSSCFNNKDVKNEYYDYEDGDDDTLVEVFNRDLSNTMKDIIKGFTDKELLVWKYRIINGLTLKEVSNIMKVSLTRVRDLEFNIIKKIKHPLSERKLDGYVNVINGDKKIEYNGVQQEILDKISNDCRNLRERLYVLSNGGSIYGDKDKTILLNLIDDNKLYDGLVRDYFSKGYCNDDILLLKYFEYLRDDRLALWSDSARYYINFVISDIEIRLDNKVNKGR